MHTGQLLAKLMAAPRKKQMKKSDYLSTGSGLFNLMCSDNVNGGLLRGQFYLYVGDSDSGKTMLMLTAFAEAANNKEFDNYQLIHDDVENGALMDFERMFGKKAAKRIRSPARDESNNPKHSTTIEDFYYNVHDAGEKGKPFIYFLDSMDALSSEAEADKFKDSKKAHRADKKIAGSYGDGKAKKNSQFLRRALQVVRDTNSILVVICQTRDNIGFGAMFNPKVRSGGHALAFYACLQIWTKRKEKLKKQVRGKKRQIGITAKVQIKRNRMTGKDRTMELPIFYSVGIDDIGSCIDYLISEGRWKGTDKSINADDFDFRGSRDKLVQYIEDENLLTDVYDIMQEVWDEVEAGCEVKRKTRYN